MSDFVMTIGGDSVPAADSFGVVNPANGEVFAHAPECTRDQLDAAFDSAAKAQRDWKLDEAARRATLLPDGRRAVRLRRGAGADPHGRAGQAARPGGHGGLRLGHVVPVLRQPRDPRPGDPGRRRRLRRGRPPADRRGGRHHPVELPRPAGLLEDRPRPRWRATPWCSSRRRSPRCPPSRSSSCSATSLPPGVLNVVSGGDDLGAWMTSHPVPRKISFTGSTATGKLVAQSAAPDLKRVTLELGGNDPAIVLDDADPAKVSHAIFAAAFNNNGQVCSAIKRVYVPESIYGDVLEGLTAEAAAVQVGDGTVPGTKLGPINNAPQFARVKELVARRAVPRRHRHHRRGRPRRCRLLLRADDPDRHQRRHPDRRRGAVRPGPARHPLPQRRRGRGAGQRHPLRPVGIGVGRGRGPGRRGGRPARVRHRVGQHPPGTRSRPSRSAGSSGAASGIENGPWGLSEFSEIQAVHRSRTADGLNIGISGIYS